MTTSVLIKLRISIDFDVQALLGWPKATESSKIVYEVPIGTVSLGKVVKYLFSSQPVLE